MSFSWKQLQQGGLLNTNFAFVYSWLMLISRRRDVVFLNCIIKKGHYLCGVYIYICEFLERTNCILCLDRIGTVAKQSV